MNLRIVCRSTSIELPCRQVIAALVIIVTSGCAAAVVGPPACDDHQVLADVNAAYAQFAKSYGQPKSIQILPRQTALLEYDARLDTPRNRELLNGYPWGPIRYCEATLKLEGGETNTVYFRIDSIKDRELFARAYPQSRDATYSLTPCLKPVGHAPPLPTNLVCGPQRAP
jgi:hypothetical protein